MRRFSKKQLILIVTSLAIVIVTIFLVSIPQRKPNQFRLTIKTVPEDATIYINNKKYSMPFSKYLDKGKYQIRIERFGFAIKEREVDLYQDDLEGLALVPVSEDAKNWKKNNQTKYADIEAITGYMAQKEGAEVGAKNPILNHLPIIKSSYQIGTQTDSEEKIVITIHSSYSTQFLAIKDLLETRLDLAGYKIKYIDDNNPSFETNPFKRLTGAAL